MNQQIAPLAPEIAQLLTTPERRMDVVRAVESLRGPVPTKAKRMDISALPANAQHHRDGLFPTVQPILVGAGNGKVLWVPTVINARDTTSRGSILWSDRERASDDREEAFALACYACDRFVVAEYLETQGFLSLPPTG